MIFSLCITMSYTLPNWLGYCTLYYGKINKKKKNYRDKIAHYNADTLCFQTLFMRHPCVVFVCMALFFIVTILLFFTVYHLGLAATNQTTNERYKKYYLKLDDKSTSIPNVYNKGIITNLLHTFFPLVYLQNCDIPQKHLKRKLKKRWMKSINVSVVYLLLIHVLINFNVSYNYFFHSTLTYSITVIYWILDYKCPVNLLHRPRWCLQLSKTKSYSGFNTIIDFSTYHKWRLIIQNFTFDSSHCLPNTGTLHTFSSRYFICFFAMLIKCYFI